MYIPMKLDYVYYLRIPLSLESLPLKVSFIPMEAYMDAEAKALLSE